MAQAFQTIYNRNYRKQAYSRRDLIKQIDEFAEKPPLEGNWRNQSTEETKTQGRSRQDLEELVDLVYKKRHRTTYFTSYCHDEAKHTFMDSDQESGDELINRGNRVFKKKIKKISPPLGTSRRLWGYMRPDSLYAPLSTYQHRHDRLAFKLLKDGFPKEDYKAMLDENRQFDAIIPNDKDNDDDDASAKSVEPMDPITKQKLMDKLDGLNTIYRKRDVQTTLDGIVCGRPAVMKLIN